MHAPRWLASIVIAGVLATSCTDATPLADEPAANEIWQADELPDELSLEDDSSSTPEDRSGPWTLSIWHELIDETISVSLVAPRGAAEVQVDTEPTYGGGEWRPVGDLRHRTPSTGTQELFVRYRDAGGEPVGEGLTAAFTLLGPLLSQTGAAIDPTRIRVTRVAPDVLQVDLVIGDVVYGPEGAQFVSGPSIDRSDLADLSRIELTVAGEAVEMRDAAVHSFPTGRVGQDTYAMHHRIHLRAAADVPEGDIVMQHDGITSSDVVATIGDRSYSPAVRANNFGWATGDGSKSAFVSTWSSLDNPIDPADLTADVVDDRGEIVLSTSGVPHVPDDSTELWRGDLTGAPTTTFDLSELSRPGSYRVCVRSIGCSQTVEISPLGPWQSTAATVARALFHQRSGTELAAPYTAITRPRPYHPDDGLSVEASDQTLFADSNGRGTGPQFTELIAGRTGATVPDAWGGHFDAGDWDRRIQHLWMARRLIDLVDEFPETIDPLRLNIPESDDDIPDLLDEALWSLDLFRRMQDADGGVRGGIEAAEHPEAGSTSWTEELDVFAYAPDPWSSSIYAGVAADAAFVLREHDLSRSEQYLTSALRAMLWAEEQLAAQPESDPDVRIQRAIAAVSIYRATGDERWHDLFLSLSSLDQDIAVEACILASSCESAWRYARLPEGLGRDDVRGRATAGIVDVADRLLFAAETTAFGWVPESADIQLIWGLGPSTPHAVGLMRAHLLTGDDRYREQAVRNANFTLGGNPAGLTYITGLGVENPRHPLMVDQQHSGLAVWPGTPVYGSFTTWRTPPWYFDAFLRRSGMQPDPAEWPTLHSFHDVGLFAGHSEFTIHQNHGETIWTFGALAATA